MADTIPVTMTQCKAWADSWAPIEKKFAISCETQFPNIFVAEKVTRSKLGLPNYYDIEHTWSYQFSQFSNWLAE